MRTTIKYRTKRRRKPIRRDIKKLLAYFVMILLVTVIPVVILNLKPISQKDIDITFDSTKNIEIPYGYLDRAHKACKDQELSFSEILTFSSYITGFNYKAYNNTTLKKAISLMKHEIMTENQKITHSIYSKVFDDLKVGPIPQKKEVYEWNDKENKWDIKKTYDYRYTSQNDFGQARTYGGNRTHDGNDLIADMGTPLLA